MKNFTGELEQFTGSTQFFRDSFNKCVYTEGFKFFMDKAKCYWLFSDIAIVVMMKQKFQQEDFINATIKVKDKKAVITLDDGNGNVLYTQKYGYTDFPLEDFSFFIVRNEENSFTFMLKGEY